MPKKWRLCGTHCWTWCSPPNSETGEVKSIKTPQNAPDSDSDGGVVTGDLGIGEAMVWYGRPRCHRCDADIDDGNLETAGRSLQRKRLLVPKHCSLRYMQERIAMQIMTPMKDLCQRKKVMFLVGHGRIRWQFCTLFEDVAAKRMTLNSQVLRSLSTPCDGSNQKCRYVTLKLSQFNFIRSSISYVALQQNIKCAFNSITFPCTTCSINVYWQLNEFIIENQNEAPIRFQSTFQT